MVLRLELRLVLRRNEDSLATDTGRPVVVLVWDSGYAEP